MTEKVNIQITNEGPVPIIKISGRLDVITSLNAETEIFKLLKQNPPALLMDFQELNYISSVGLKVLLKTAKHMRDRSLLLVFYNIQPNVMSVFILSGFDKFINIKVNEYEALLELEKVKAKIT